MRLETPRLTLREYTEDDFAAVFAYQSDPRYLRYYPWEGRTLEDVQRFVRTFIDWQPRIPATSLPTRRAAARDRGAHRQLRRAPQAGR